MRNLIVAILMVFGLSSCIEDGLTFSPADTLRFESDTLQMGTVIAGVATPTYSIKIYNPNSKGLIISSISLADEAMERVIRLNVDGEPGARFRDIEVRAGDSIFVKIEATMPEAGLDEPQHLMTNLDFVCNGVKHTLVIAADVQDVIELRGWQTSSGGNFRLTGARPYRVMDSLVVAEGSTLTLEPGCRLLFHDKARMVVKGTLHCLGSADGQIDMSGDRFGSVATNIPYDIMSGQWDGIYFTPTSHSNVLTYTTVRNTTRGIIADSLATGTGSQPTLTLINCRLRNSKGAVLTALQSPVVAIGCELAEGGEGIVRLSGGPHVINHCTLANNYLFSAANGALLNLADSQTRCEVTNSIMSGYGGMVSPANLDTIPGAMISHTLIHAPAGKQEQFVECIWDKDPLFYTIRTDYLFDYELRPESPAIGVANPELMRPQAAIDRLGRHRGASPDLGAYVFTPR